VRLFRGRWPGFILGGALAVSWSLFQKLFVLLMTYGPDFVKLYEQLYFMAARTLQLGTGVPFDLVKAIFVIDLSFGALVAALAFRSKKSTPKSKPDLLRQDVGAHPENFLAATVAQPYSLSLFFLNLLILFGGLTFLDELSLPQGSAVILVYVTLNIARYARSLKRLQRPQLWLQLMAIMALSGLLLGGWQDQAAILNGLQAGLGMAIRALLVIFGFSALSIEFRNPVIIDWFSRRGMGIVFEALSVSFEVLPRLMKLVSAKQRIWRHPFQALNQFLSTLELLLAEHTAELSRVIILSGEQGVGKTNLIKQLLACPELADQKFSGILTEGTWQENQRDHYHTFDLETGASALLCERAEPVSKIRSGPFNFREDGIVFGRDVLDQAVSAKASVVIIDEIGHLELADQGWAAPLKQLVDLQQPMIWTVRTSLLDQVVAKWPVKYRLLDTKHTDVDELIRQIRNFLITETAEPGP
ncbi:MAG: hypothetical protein L3J79_08455, partial [Candidatus Marinimicrobia bacterium]|nr:hypothetical protein [Candidatus Neomarinimicrobiota bacterium]